MKKTYLKPELETALSLQMAAPLMGSIILNSSDGSEQEKGPITEEEVGEGAAKEGWGIDLGTFDWNLWD